MLNAVLGEGVASDQITVALPVFLTCMGVGIASAWTLRGMMAGRDSALSKLQAQVDKLEKGNK